MTNTDNMVDREATGIADLDTKAETQAQVLVNWAKDIVDDGPIMDEVTAFWINETQLGLVLGEWGGLPDDERVRSCPQVKALSWWWSLNTEAFGYDSQRQHKLIPDWAHSHSGASAGFCYGRALWDLNELYRPELNTNEV